MAYTQPVIYRVRKSFDDIKSQKGAYFVLENAIKRAIITKRNVYDDNKKCVWSFSGENSKKAN
jgi:hypothetical protein